MKTRTILFSSLLNSVLFLSNAQEQKSPGLLVADAKKLIQVEPAQILTDLSHEDYTRRLGATQTLLVWGKDTRKESVAVLLDMASEAKAPEARERVLCVLREMAKADYVTIGEGYCGIQMAQISDMRDVPERGKLAAITLTFIAADGPAEKAGLRVNDAIVSVDETVWKNPDNQTDQLRKMIREKGAGKTIKIGVMREGKYHEYAVELHRRPPKIDAIPNGQNFFFGGGIAQIPKIDQHSLDELKKEDLESDEFFEEWLRKEKELRKHK
jgi:membrane-associated protease RseP (regulator of RpoE activity)